MLRELAHFLRYAPSAGRLQKRTDRVAFLDRVEGQLDQAGKARWRAALVADLAGEVLEIGAGTGTMFAHYPVGVRLTAIEPDEGFLALAAERAKHAPVPIQLQAGVGESLPFPDASFDGVVCASVLCSVRSVRATLAEIKRVLKPGGRLRLIEHTKSERLVAGALQELFNPIWRALNRQGCNMNRDPRPALGVLGFTTRQADRFQIFVPAMPAAFENQVIWAVRA